MPYNIFLSFSAQEVELAEHVHNALNNAFKGNVKFFYSKENIIGGDKWKDVVQNALKTYDSILTILTPKYIQRPWAYIEWASFWVSDRKTFIAISEDVDFKDIVDPMRESQVIRLFDEESIKRLLEGICLAAKIDFVPYEASSTIANKSKIIYEKILESEKSKHFTIYKNEIELLPEDDGKKIEILWYFFEKENDRETFRLVFEKINDNSIKAGILLRLLNKNELDLIELCFEYVENRASLGPLLRSLADNGFENSTLIDKIIEYAVTSQTTIRSFAEYLIKNGRVDTKLLLNIFDMLTNSVELRKVGDVLVDNSLNNTVSFENIIQILDKRRSDKQLATLIIYLIKSRKYLVHKIEYMIRILASNSQKETISVLHVWYENNKESAKKLILNEKIITNAEELTRLLKILKEIDPDDRDFDNI